MNLDIQYYFCLRLNPSSMQPVSESKKSIDQQSKRFSSILYPSTRSHTHTQKLSQKRMFILLLFHTYKYRLNREV